MFIIIMEIEIVGAREVSSVRGEGRVMSGLGPRSKISTKRITSRYLNVDMLKGLITRNRIVLLRAGVTSSKPVDST